MERNIYPKNLLVSLDEFVQQMHRLNKADNPKLVSQIITKWTKAQPLLTKKLLQYVLESKQKISLGEEAYTVEKIVRNRLIKEFKQDELTFNIRKFLYTKDLISLIKKTQGNIATKEKIYLKSLQNEFGLSDRQCQLINNYYLPFNSLSKTNVFHSTNDGEIIKLDRAEEDSYQDLIFLVQQSPVYNDILTIKNKGTIFNKRKLTIHNIFKQKKSWIWLILLLLLLL